MEAPWLHQMNIPKKYARVSSENRKPKSSIGSRIRTTARSTYISLANVFSGQTKRCFLRCIYCHFAFDDQVNQLEKTIQLFQKWGEFIDTEQAVAMVAGRKPIDGPFFHLSFDDGFKSIIQNALPVLAKYRVPSIFFVPSAIVASDYDIARPFSHQTTNNHGVLELADWDDLRRASDQGMEIGSHTRTHCRLSSLKDPKELAIEIGQSKIEIEAKIGTPCKYISWPYGTFKDISTLALEQIKDAGYEACFSAVRGTVSSASDPFIIPRHHFELHWPFSHIAYFGKGNKEK
jgi:peptidoglycan/xylan/chitin deacetylase (PgdA/CDA1 family)